VRFRVERDVLAEAVAWTARSLPARPPVPVLAGLLLEAGPDGLRLSGFDYEVSARVTIAADVIEPGRALVSGRLLADISRSLPARPVEISTDGPKVQLVCGSARFSLLTLPVEDYPTLPEMPGVTGTLSSALFAAAVAQVAIAAGRDDTLPVLTGIRVEIEGDTVTLAATDRYRLAVRELSWRPETTGLDAIALVPARTLAETAKSLAGADSVSIALASGASGEGLMGFDGSGRRTTTRLLEGEFPKYRALLPSEALTVADVDTASLVEVILRSRPHPEQGFRACLGILRLARQYGVDRLEAACKRGLEISARSYGSINSILQNGLDRQPLTRASNAPELPLDHPNIRGSRYYH